MRSRLCDLTIAHPLPWVSMLFPLTLYSHQTRPSKPRYQLGPLIPTEGIYKGNTPSGFHSPKSFQSKKGSTSGEKDMSLPKEKRSVGEATAEVGGGWRSGSGYRGADTGYLGR